MSETASKLRVIIFHVVVNFKMIFFSIKFEISQFSIHLSVKFPVNFERKAERLNTNANVFVNTKNALSMRTSQ